MTEKDVQVISFQIDKEKEHLDAISMSIWKKPELMFREVHAHDLLTNALEKYGFSVQREYLLETAFRAEYSRGDGPVVAVLCEYDALPEIGHACGHNLIAEAGIAAAVGIKAAIEADAALAGKVVVLGCPAEEGGAGKVRLIEGGAFEGIDAAMMVHPTSINLAAPPFLCIERAKVTYKGREAHASGYPWEGINALDAAVAAYVNIGLLRQHIKPMCRIHGIITKGGTAPNVIPGESALEFFIRAPTLGELRSLKERVRACFRSAASATGCEMEEDFMDSSAYRNVISNKVLVSIYKEYAERLGLHYVDDSPEERSGYPETAASTDMGNVSYVLPSIHPLFKIGHHRNHTKEFAEQSSSDFAHQMARTAGKGMAMTAVRLFRNTDIIEEMKQEFLKEVESNES